VQTVVLVDDHGRREKQTAGLEYWQKKSAEALGTRLSAFSPVMPKAG